MWYDTVDPWTGEMAIAVRRTRTLLRVDGTLSLPVFTCWSPDGKLFPATQLRSVAGQEAGENRLVVLEGATGSIIPLEPWQSGNNPISTQLRWSQDGAWVIHRRFVGESQEIVSEVLRSDLRGHKERLSDGWSLTHVYQPYVGSALVTHELTSSDRLPTYRCSVLEGSSRREILPGYTVVSVSVSLDGRTIAAICDPTHEGKPDAGRGSEVELRLCGMDGKPGPLLATGRFCDYWVRWSPDGTSLLVEEVNTPGRWQHLLVRLVQTDGSGTSTLTEENGTSLLGWQFQWGEKDEVLYLADGKIMSYNLRTKEQQQVFPFPK